ncbi:hypothetical protein Nepgr_031127 [Nepenthes gracilis]|uniref:Major facilitator superfamily (MFS) profile domain-containing protein n=1 Tax=Nepenthes gracilis TaxID=150966 RepID=A0AAD3THQ5_NEPGR|nr:hypothetical protein Nepgr_031127 [Nepenthes gracilis]
MAIDQGKDFENAQSNGLEDLEAPLLVQQGKASDYEIESKAIADAGGGGDDDGGSIGMVLLSTAVAVCGSFEFGSCVGYSAPTQSAIRKDLNLSLEEYSVFGSILTIGAMFGAITSGRITDFVGRKWAMRISSCFCIVGWLAVFFARGALVLDIGRLFNGYGIGVLSYVIPIFIAEIAPKNLRGGLTTLNQLMIVVGSSFSFLIGSIVSWQILALIGLLPCVALLLGLFLVPESPRWLAKVGLQKEFKTALRQLRGKDANISHEVDEIEEYIATIRSLPKAKLFDLFQGRYIRSVIIGVGLMVLQQFGGINGIGFYLNETFQEAGLSSGKIGTIAYAILQVPITLVGALLMDKSGRRPLVMVSATGTFLGCFLTATGFLLKSHDALLRWVPILGVSGVLIYISAFSIGMGAVPWVIMSEIFPINVKGAAGSLVVLVNWSGAWLVSFTFNFLMNWSMAGTFYIFGGFCAFTVLFVAKIVPETKGKTLEEIQASINRKQYALT